MPPQVAHIRAARAAVLALTLVGTSLGVAPGAAAAPTTLALAITTASAAPKVPFKNFDGNPPKLFDFDRDGRLEIIAQNDNQYVYVFNSTDGRILFEAKTKFPPGWAARSFNGPEVALMAHGENVRLVVANSAAFITSFWLDPSGSNGTKMGFVKEWERRLNDCYPDPGMDAKPVLADLDRDGRLDIVAATEETGLFALRDDGSLLWKQCIGGGNAEPGIGDLNLDGYPDVVHGSDGGNVVALNGLSGAYLWTYNVKADFNLGSGSMPAGPAVAQLDGLGGPDVIVGARDSHDTANWSNDHALLLALSSGGALLWARQDPVGNPLTATRPIVVDAALDGTPEVYWADWNTIGHNPPSNAEDAWKRTGPANFYRYSANGTLDWKTTLGTYWNNKDLALGDVDADGVQEVLANGPGPGGDGIWYLNSNTGAAETFVGTHPWKVSRAPVLADLWATGTMQWVVQAEADDSSVSGGAILVYDTGVPYSATWPHEPYPTLGPPPPDPSTIPRFNSTFTVQSPNPYWQEVRVTPAPPEPVSALNVRLNQGAWKPMTLRHWGSWTASQHAPAGTLVEFRATNATSAWSQSAPFTWLDGNLSQPSVVPPPPPPPKSTFDATFVVPSGANNHWVEVNVSSIHVVTNVRAHIHGGLPVALERQPWGNWAKGMFVADGTIVRFVANNTVNHTATSPNFTWVPPPPPPPPAFNATFTVPSNVNNWWVEVKVTGSQYVAGVSASVNGGSPVALEKKSWGNWAKSFFVATGSTVRFQATNVPGHASYSENFTWLGPAPPPPEPGPFNASFVVSSSVNNWWVDVKVTGTQPVAGVSAIVNGGTPVALQKQSWGTWAKSFFVATGSLVQFVARNATGASVTSGNITWLAEGLDDGPLAATFTPKSQHNPWWVEVKVDANHLLSAVHAQVNNGTWIELPPTTWGTWAKSFFVATGSEVRFRATDTANETVLSSVYSWG